MSKRTKYLLGIGVIAALVIGWQVAAYAVHDEGVFQLDGNAVTVNPPPGDDWDKICKTVADGPPAVSGLGCTSATGSTTAIDTAFLEEEPADASSIFTGGGSKDPQDIPNWKWKDGGGLPDKDNLLHAFAATYTAPATAGSDAGDELLYFGSDRFDNSGDAVQGFWFFQNEVTTGGTPSGTFTGTHAEGDLLVLSDFSNGGTTATIAVYEWDTRCTKAGQKVDVNNTPNNPNDDLTCGDANLLTLASSNSARCPAPDVQLADDRFCGIVNPTNGTVAPWTYTDKSGNNTYLQGEFYEAGLNLTDLGLGDKCFSSVAAETRSSTSTTAVLKDFVLGGFGNCTGELTTTPVPASDISVGDTVHDEATLEVTGTSTWEGTLKFFVCSPTVLETANTSTCSGDLGTQVGSDIPVTNATSQPISSADVTVDEPGTWCFRGEFISGTTGVPDSTDATAGECFTVNQPTDVTTRQRWVPQDTATVTPDGTAGAVTFNLYLNGDCSGTPDQTFVVNDPNATTGEYETANTEIIDTTTVSWQASFDPDGAEDPSTGVCETSTVTFDDDGPDPAP